MRKIFFFSALAMSLALHQPAAQADEAVRAAQEALKSEGYYTGPVEGELNADTKAALRRFQMRNELEPTGELTPETMAALNKGAQSAAPAEAPAPQAPPAVPSAPLATPQPYAQPVAPPAASMPPAAPTEAIETAYAALFARTPYRNAPPEVQRDTLRKAQVLLSERGFYQGPVNGLPSPATEEALIRFQASRNLARTGSFDIDTLAELHLLPVSRLQMRPHNRPNPNGAVRGVPLD